MSCWVPDSTRRVRTNRADLAARTTIDERLGLLDLVYVDGNPRLGQGSQGWATTRRVMQADAKRLCGIVRWMDARWAGKAKPQGRNSCRDPGCNWMKNQRQVIVPLDCCRSLNGMWLQPSLVRSILRPAWLYARPITPHHDHLASLNYTTERP